MFLDFSLYFLFSLINIIYIYRIINAIKRKNLPFLSIIITKLIKSGIYKRTENRKRN